MSRYIAFSSNRDGDSDVFDIYVMAADGSEVRQLTDHSRRELDSYLVSRWPLHRLLV